MRAVRFAAFGEPAEVLRVEDVPQPQPGPDEVLIRLQARPINPSDLFAIRGRYGVLPQLPAVGGMEGAGVVAALGANVTGLQIGQQVVPLAANGTWQEYVTARPDTLLPLPPGLSDTQAAMVLANPTSAWVMLETLGVQPGEWVLQNAGNSAVARHVAQIGRRRGFRTISVVRRRDVIDDVLADGAEHVICETDEDVVARVHAITGGKGVRYALDAVAGASGERLLNSLARGGTLLVYGAQSEAPLHIDAGRLLFRGLGVRGWWLVQWFRTTPRPQQRAVFDQLFPLIVDGTVRAPVAATFDLADVQQAVAAAENSARNGKIVLVG